MPIPAFAAREEVPAGSDLQRWPKGTPFSYPVNLTQQPAISLPCGLTSEGLPAGLQIVGPRFAAALVLRAARAFEKEPPWPFPALEVTLKGLHHVGGYTSTAPQAKLCYPRLTTGHVSTTAWLATDPTSFPNDN